MMGLETTTRDGDAVIEANGIKVFLDEGSQPHVAGMTVDFVTGLESSGSSSTIRMRAPAAPAANPSADRRIEEHGPCGTIRTR